ncbi:MAG: hypothetical protein AAGC88_09930, partial [Bacteroidota bacterium]
VFLFSCGGDDIAEPDLTLPGNPSPVNVISSPTLQIDEIFSDEFTILSATPYEDRFEIVVEYGGGCAEHEFDLMWDHVVAESFPAQTWMTLTHNANNDMCRALVRDTLNITYESIDGFSIQDMIVHLVNGNSDQQVTIDSRIIPLMTEACELEVSLERAICGIGPWGDLWFKLPTEIGAWEEVWLQPVKVAEEFELMNPAAGSTARIKVKGMFGYQYPLEPDQFICLALPAGLILPVEVLCME